MGPHLLLLVACAAAAAPRGAAGGHWPGAEDLHLLSGVVRTAEIRSHHEFEGRRENTAGGPRSGRRLADGEPAEHFLAVLQEPIYSLPAGLADKISSHVAPAGAIVYARYSEAKAAAGHGKPFSWVAPLNATHKIDPGLAHLSAAAAARRGTAPTSSTRTALQLFFAPAAVREGADAAGEAVQDAVAGALRECAGLSGGADVAVERPHRIGRRHSEHWVAAVDLHSMCAAENVGAVARALAALPAVWWVGREFGAAPTNYWSSALLTSFNATPSGEPRAFSEFQRAGVDGSGVVVGVSDSGLDRDMCYFRDDSTPDFQPDKHYPDARKLVFYQTQPDTDDFDRPDGHGTHVSGTVAGANLGDECGGPRHNGIAPGAKLHFMDLEKEHPGSWEHDWRYPSNLYEEMWVPAYNTSGARVYSMSWACHIPTEEHQVPFQACNFYGKWCWEADAFVDDHPDMLLLYAAGNKGGQTLYQSLLHPSVAKNVIGVGASSIPFAGWEEAHLYDPSKPDVDDRTYYSEHAMAHFTGTGPAFDGRAKPDLMAPGHRLLSARSDGNLSSDNCGLYLMSGTSMATPSLAGAAAVLRQYLQDGYWGDGTRGSARGLNPSSALMRSLLTASAMVNATMDRENGLWLDGHSFDIERQSLAPVPLRAQPYSQFHGTYQAEGHAFQTAPIGFAWHFHAGHTAPDRFHLQTTEPVARLAIQLVCYTGQVNMYYDPTGNVSATQHAAKSEVLMDANVTEIVLEGLGADEHVFLLLQAVGGNDASYCFLNPLAYTSWPAPAAVVARCRDRALHGLPAFNLIRPRELYPAHYRLHCPLGEECEQENMWDLRGTAQYRGDSAPCLAARHAGLRRRGRPGVFYATMLGNRLHWVDEKFPSQWSHVRQFEASAMNGVESSYSTHDDEDAFELWTGIWHGYEGPERVLAGPDADAFDAAEPGARQVWHPWWGFGFPTLRRAAPLAAHRGAYRPFLLALGEEPAPPPGADSGAYTTLRSGFVTANSSAVAQGETRAFCIDLPAGAAAQGPPRGVGAASFSLVWTDPPASVGAAAAIVHDLDLLVTVDDPLRPGGGRRRAWFGNHGRAPDAINTVEKVRLERPDGSQVCARVTGARVHTRPVQAFALTALFERGGGGALPASLAPACAPGCHASMRGNGACDRACDVATCDSDGGDCRGGPGGASDVNPWLGVAVTFIALFSLVVLGGTVYALTGRLHRSRRAAVAGGGPYRSATPFDDGAELTAADSAAQRGGVSGAAAGVAARVRSLSRGTGSPEVRPREASLLPADGDTAQA